MLNNIVTTVLRREGKISLPSIGIIVKAEFDGDTTYLFTPTAAKPDSNMVGAIASEMSVSIQEATNVLDSYIDFMKSIIAKNGRYHIVEVGDIMRNDGGVYYFMPLNTLSPMEEIIEEVRQEIIENEVVVEEVEDNGVPATVEEGAERLNERFQSKRLGEIMDGSANKRFYDKVHSQVVASANEPVSTIITEETTTVKRKGLYDIYDKGLVRKEPVAVNPVPVVAHPPVYAQPAVEVAAPAPAPVFAPASVATPKKKTDVVLIISIIIIVIGLAFIGYFYMQQQDLQVQEEETEVVL